MAIPLSKNSAAVAADDAEAKPRKRRKSQASATTTIRDLVSYRLSRTATLISRGAALRYRRQFGVSLGEWRALALLAGPPMTVMELTRAAGLDKAQMSRVVSSLTERGLVRREVSPSDSRAGMLSLTPSGREIYAGLIAAANQRDRVFRAALTADELAMLETVLDKLADVARHFIRAEAEE